MRQDRRISRARGALVLASLLVGLSLVAGCGDGKIAVYPVSGMVRVNGQPAAGALVTFCPIEGSEEFRRERPFGNTDANGKFQLTTFSPQDGAPAGNYKVMVQWPVPRGAASSDPNRPTGEIDRLQGRYINPETSGLTVVVEEQATEISPFELNTK